VCDELRASLPPVCRRYLRISGLVDPQSAASTISLMVTSPTSISAEPHRCETSRVQPNLKVDTVRYGLESSSAQAACLKRRRLLRTIPTIPAANFSMARCQHVTRDRVSMSPPADIFPIFELDQSDGNKERFRKPSHPGWQYIRCQSFRASSYLSTASMISVYD
jgi:hypothetical protein